MAIPATASASLRESGIAGTKQCLFILSQRADQRLMERIGNSVGRRKKSLGESNVGFVDLRAECGVEIARAVARLHLRGTQLGDGALQVAQDLCCFRQVFILSPAVTGR